MTNAVDVDLTPGGFGLPGWGRQRSIPPRYLGDQRWVTFQTSTSTPKAKDSALILDIVAKGFVALLVPVETKPEEYEYRHPDLYGAQTRTRDVPASIAGMSTT
jgi:hypothetical protein